MKKLLFILLISIVSFSCSKDDEAISETVQTEIQTDQIVGEWQFGKVVYYYKDGTTETREPTVCDLQCSWSFLEDHSIFLVSYVADNDGGCELEPVNNAQSTWEKIAKNKYKLEYPEETQILEPTFTDSKTMVVTKTITSDISEVGYTESYYNRIP